MASRFRPKRQEPETPPRPVPHAWITRHQTTQKLAELLTLHTDDVFRLEEVLHVVRRVGVYATMGSFHPVSPRQADSASLGLILQFRHLAHVEPSLRGTLIVRREHNLSEIRQSSEIKQLLVDST